ncbi:MAG: hypothetical protein ACJAZB_000474 [Psychrosphaera sp.]|jgi:hypothetical protein|uniref:hypothetical protein n=1 Tax=Psychrosphaera sp. F3M07 TaxID=2841560 RepID=UPI001C08E37F|nr:hypothetical protein [Psychrosphaera sp. F3M07]MBU2917111.1 hypothetical protein [Psychrosphaera sp. F3M07]
MTSIHDLAKCILLDDVNDVFYRSLCFSTYARSEYDDKTATEKKLDVMLDQRLARQLNWSSSICSLDTATHKFSHLLESLINKQISQTSLISMIEDNYWLRSAIEIELGKEVFAEAIAQQNLLEHLKTPVINKRIAHIGWRYFASQMSDHNQYLLQQIIEFSDAVAQQTIQNSFEESELVDEDMAYHLAFVNSYSFVVLLKLFDKAVQSIKYEALNTTAFECEQQRELINQYLPTAESLLSFMIFDEFLKPHVFDNLNLVQDTYTNLLNGTEILDGKSKIFIKSRGEIIVERLSKTSVLTARQLADFSSQVGIKFEVKQVDSELGKSAKLWAKLLASMPTLTPAS